MNFGSTTFNSIRRGKFVTDLARRDGYQTMDEYRYNHWGRVLCTYYAHTIPNHPRKELALNALEWAKNNANT